MIQRRTFLSAFPMAFLAACGRPQATQAADMPKPEMPGLPAQSLKALLGEGPSLRWLTARGSVRLSADNGQVRPATLQRAILVSQDGSSARFFDIWQVGDEAAKFGPVQKRGEGINDIAPNDLGENGLWLQRAFIHPAFQGPIEVSRIALTGARVMVIDATQIWVVEGSIGASPSLRGEVLGQFEAWQRAG